MIQTLSVSPASIAGVTTECAWFSIFFENPFVGA
jgi:hypothetical protein